MHSRSVWSGAQSTTNAATVYADSCLVLLLSVTNIWARGSTN